MTDCNNGAHYSLVLELVVGGEFDPRVVDDLFLRLHQVGTIRVVRIELVALEFFQSIGSISAHSIVNGTARDTLICNETRKLH